MRQRMMLRTALAFVTITALGGLRAEADLFLWMGDTGPDGAAWCNQDNWALGRGYPGQRDTADIVLIPGVRTSAPVLNRDPEFAVADVFIFDGGSLTVAGALAVRNDVIVNTGASLSVSGTMPEPEASTDGVEHECEIVIDSVVTLTGTISTYCKLTIEPGGELRIQGNGLFEQTQDVRDEIGGMLELKSSNSIFRAKADVVLGPYTVQGEDPVYGDVRGCDPDARIQIERGRTLTNDVNILGMLTIETY